MEDQPDKDVRFDGDFRTADLSPFDHLYRPQARRRSVFITGKERDLGKPEATKIQFRIGRLLIHNLQGWIKVELLCKEQDSEAELLNPNVVKQLVKWFSQFSA